MRQRLWPRDRLAIAILLYAIWIPFIAMLVVYVNDNEDSNTASEVRTEEDEPDDFAETVGWTWGVLWVGYAGLAAWLARIKGRDPIRWGLASLLTFIALFPFLAVAPDRQTE
ncbi:MAG: hypothetical protein OXH19_02135 [Chloroflexi bacterium]|nr:hypothetical protein [Chloroflexota bacterium]MCY3587165.1 hypothetical protein [Chloroflexota bacterium]MCY3686630.1 hypothetical protein [Chloroflexota bacterium]MDE2708018.1 hypothetical protein [Chloroflexota bacterium]